MRFQLIKIQIYVLKVTLFHIVYSMYNTSTYIPLVRTSSDMIVKRKEIDLCIYFYISFFFPFFFLCKHIVQRERKCMRSHCVYNGVPTMNERHRICVFKLIYPKETNYFDVNFVNGYDSIQVSVI